MTRLWSRSLPVMLCLLASAALAQGPNPQRFEKDIVKLEQSPPTSPGGIMFLGSSSIRLWDLTQAFPELNAVNHGFGGSQISDSVHYFDRLVVPWQPRTIVMYAGDNDLNSGKSPCKVHEDFQQLVAKLHAALPETRLIYISIKPSVKRWNLITKMRAANALIEMECAADPLLTFVDVEPLMLADKQTPPPADLFVADGLHMTPKGYAIWIDALNPLLSEAQVPVGADQSKK